MNIFAESQRSYLVGYMTIQNLVVSLALILAIALDTAAKYVPAQGALSYPLILSIAAGVFGAITLGRRIYWEDFNDGYRGVRVPLSDLLASMCLSLLLRLARTAGRL